MIQAQKDRNTHARGHRCFGVVQKPGKRLSDENERRFKGPCVRLKNKTKKNFRQVA